MEAKKKKYILLILIFASLYYLLRIALYIVDVTVGVPLDVEPSAEVRAFIDYSYLSIGVIGLIGVLGLIKAESWGYWCTLSVSAYTIVFDAWAAAVVQVSAVAGLVPPIILIVYLLANRSVFSSRRE